MSDDRYENVTIIKKANVYFDGRVTSRTVVFGDGSRKTLGIMMPGDYEFSTGAAELMEVLNGDMRVLLPGASAWQVFGPGSSFRVPANSSFKLEIAAVADYCCSYGEA
jgi:purine/pyrimidine-nucleoside phosphorylase